MTLGLLQDIQNDAFHLFSFLFDSFPLVIITKIASIMLDGF